MIKVLSLDMSTTGTGWAEWDAHPKKWKPFKLLSYGLISPKLSRQEKLSTYPTLPLYKQLIMAKEIKVLAEKLQPQYIIIEEINRGKNRISQKTLDGLHAIVMERFLEIGFNTKVFYVDSDGDRGWRSKWGLGLHLNPSDKLLNSENKKINKTLNGKTKKVNIIDKKDLSCRFIKKEYNIFLEKKHNDIADAIGLGHFFLAIYAPHYWPKGGLRV